MIAPSVVEANNIFRRLAAPFQDDEVAWRIARAGTKHGRPWAQVLAYIDARAARARLNAVLGPANWRVEYSYGAHGGVLATLSLRVDGEWIAKQDGADVSEREPVKGAISGAFKRACAVWGIGEYLYEVGESWAVFSDAGAHRVQIDGSTYRWDAPSIAPKQAEQSPEGSVNERSRTTSSAPRHDAPTKESASLMRMPFGRHRGMALRDIPLSDLLSARAWAVQNKRAYPGFLEAVAFLELSETLTA